MPNPWLDRIEAVECAIVCIDDIGYIAEQIGDEHMETLAMKAKHRLNKLEKALRANAEHVDQRHFDEWMIDRSIEQVIDDNGEGQDA